MNFKVFLLLPYFGLLGCVDLRLYFWLFIIFLHVKRLGKRKSRCFKIIGKETPIHWSLARRNVLVASQARRGHMGGDSWGHRACAFVVGVFTCLFPGLHCHIVRCRFQWNSLKKTNSHCSSIPEHQATYLPMKTKVDHWAKKRLYPLTPWQ